MTQSADNASSRPDTEVAPTKGGRLEAIWIKRMKRGPMDRKDRVSIVAGRGLVDNADQGRKRQVTILSKDAWHAAELELGASIDPATRRANLLIAGLDLANSRRRILSIGECRFEIWGETRPCNRMEEAHAGLEAALGRDWRGGIYGVALDNGEIAIGDPVIWLD